MFLSKFAIEKPITTTMIFLVIIVFSVYAILHIPVSLMPNISYPQLSVVASWSQVSPEEVEAKITSPIESIGSLISGVTEISSTSYPGYAQVKFQFDRKTNINFAKFELNEKLQLLSDKFPPNVVPKIREYVPREFRDKDFLSYGIAGPYNLEEIEKFIDRHLKYKILSLEGVSGISIDGTRQRVIKILLDSNKSDLVSTYILRKTLLAHGINGSISDFDKDGLSYTISVEDEFQRIEEIKTLKIPLQNGQNILLSEIAEIKEDYYPARSYLRYNCNPQLTFSIDKKSTANALKLAKSIKSIVKKQKEYFPEDISFVKLSDESEKILDDLNVLYKRGFFALIIISLVLLLFLKHMQSTFLVLLTIFFSAGLTIICLYFLKIGLNMLSLAGLTLGFGMIVDNSIVVYENIFRFQNLGYEKKSASLLGVKEVALTITASTLTTVIVFAPFLFLQGNLKLFYLPFVYATVLSLLSSLFVSFTFIPLVAFKFLRTDSQKIEKKNRILDIYQIILQFLLCFRWIWLIVVLGFLAFSTWIFIEKVDKGFSWSFPDDSYLSIYISLPVGSNIDQVDYIAKKFEEKISDNDLDISMKSKVYEDFARIRVDFDEETKKTAYPLFIREKLKAYAVNFGNSSIYVQGFGPSFGGGGYSISNHSLELSGFNYETLKEVSQNLAEYMKRTSKRVTDINANALSWWKNDNLYEYLIIFDRDKLAMHNLDILNVSARLSSVLSSMQNQFKIKINEEEKSVIILKDIEKDYYGISELKDLIITNSQGAKIRFSEIMEIEKKEIISEIRRKDKLYQRRINFDYRGSHKKAKKFIEQIKETYQMPLGYSFKDEEKNDDDESDKKQMLYLLIFALILVYMSLCSLYESFKYPLIVILSIPLAFTGVALIFYFTSETFDSYARIGLVLLSGIVVNNSIILVDHINHLRLSGISKKLAVINASKDRIRPILMTTLTTIMGLLPMLLQSDISQNKFWRLLSLSTIGGLITSTFFVLTFIPVIYYIFSKESR